MSSPKKTLYLIDGSGFIFRAFYGLPPLTNKHGEPVGAVLGFCNMITKFFLEHQPNYWVVVFDSGRKTFRHEMYPDYKSHRPPAPPELQSQFSLIHDACRAFSIPTLSCDYAEADDLIATLAYQSLDPKSPLFVLDPTASNPVKEPDPRRRLCQNSMDNSMACEGNDPFISTSQANYAQRFSSRGISFISPTYCLDGFLPPQSGPKDSLSQQSPGEHLSKSAPQATPSDGLSVCILSADKDLMQLIGPSVTLWDPMKNIPIGPQQVLDKFGVEPKKIPDIQGLVGDSSDHIPGVPGIGIKTAMALIQEFGSIENLYQCIQKMAFSKRRTALENHQEQAFISKKLATLAWDLSLDIPLMAFQAQPFSKSALDFLETHGLSNLRQRLSKHIEPFADTPVASTTSFDANINYKDTSPADQPWENNFVQNLSRKPIEDKSRALEKALAYLKEPTSFFAPMVRLKTLEQLKEFLGKARLSGVLALDGASPDNNPVYGSITGLSFAFLDKNGDIYGGYCWMGDFLESQVLECLESLWSDPGILKIGSDLKFWMNLLQGKGITYPKSFDDVCVMAYLLEGPQTPFSKEADEASQPQDLSPIHNTSLSQTTNDCFESKSKGPPTDPVQMSLLDCNLANPKVCQTLKSTENPEPWDPHCPNNKSDKIHEPLECWEKIPSWAHKATAWMGCYWTLKQNILSQGNVALYEKIEKPSIPVVAAMERHGILLDRQTIETLKIQLDQELQSIETEIFHETGVKFNLGSPKQLGFILFETLKMPGGKKNKTGSYKTGSDILESLQEQGYRLPEKILHWRQLSKLRTTYTDSLIQQIDPKNGVVHTIFGLTNTSTGRLSSMKPNLQNIPARSFYGQQIRHAFRADPENLLLMMDYSQIELRLLAHMGPVKPLLQAFSQGKDVHVETAKELFETHHLTPELRRQGKIINFGIIYGISSFGLAKQMGIPVKTAKEYIEKYLLKYPGIQEYMDRTMEQGQDKGYVETLLGRRCWIPGLQASQTILRKAAQRQAINAPLQGSSADIIKKAMVHLDRFIQDNRLPLTLVLQIHDELIFQIPKKHDPEWILEMKKIMENVVKLTVPLEVSIDLDTHWR
jgi:DNA polymerase I